jgi:hypothetical protein
MLENEALSAYKNKKNADSYQNHTEEEIRQSASRAAR